MFRFWWTEHRKKVIAAACVLFVLLGLIWMYHRINPLLVDRVVVYGYELDEKEAWQLVGLYNFSGISTKFPGGEPCTPDQYVYIYFCDGSFLKMTEHGRQWEYEADYVDADGQHGTKKRVYIENERLQAFVDALYEKHSQSEEQRRERTFTALLFFAYRSLFFARISRYSGPKLWDPPAVRILR